MKHARGFRTWITIRKSALFSNARQFMRLIPKETRFMAVVKSNAYGHGLVHVAGALNELPAFRERGWFGVDSVVEALRLREKGIGNPILVLGFTLPSRLRESREAKIALTVSSFEALHEIGALASRPVFHIKVDTGMHRQGFFPQEMPKVVKVMNRFGMEPEGLYTHFAAAKDGLYPAATLHQMRQFRKAHQVLKKAGYKKAIAHAAASGGALLFPETHLDMVRVGMGLYGYFPSPEAHTYLGGKVKLEPVLSWHAVVGGIKEIPKGSGVGYDFAERVSRNTKAITVPVGYWHGYDRGFSSVGEVIAGGIRRKVLGRVSMDMLIADATDGRKKLSVGDHVVLLGSQGGEAILADELALKIGTSPYEVLTRINPLIHKDIV